MNRRRGCVWFAAGLFLAMMAGVLIFMTIQRATQVPQTVEEPPRMEVLVAARDIPLHTVVSADDVMVSEVPPEIVPAGALLTAEEAEGKLTTADIASGEIVLERRLISPDYVGPRTAFVMDPSKVLVAYPAMDLLSSQGIIRPGDHVDLMFSFDFDKLSPDIQTGINTLTVLQDLVVADVVYPCAGAPSAPEQATGQQPAVTCGVPRALLLAIDEQDALLIKYFRDQGAAPDLALRSPAAEGEFEVVPIDGDYLLQRLKIRWRVKEQ